MKIILILLVVVLISCDQTASAPDPEWKTAPVIYKCTQREMQKVEHESEWCSKNTDYFDEYCYGSAIIRNCKKSESPK